MIAQLGVTLGVWGSIWLDIQTGACYRFGTGYFIFCGAHYLKANKQKIRIRIHLGKILVPTPLALFTYSTKLPNISAITFRS